MRTSTKEVLLYETWYQFKAELQRRSGLVLLNHLWMQVKPREPLPWYEFQMKEALAKLSSKIQKLTVCPRCGGNLVLDRDIDGYYKRCIQCSFNITIEDVQTQKAKIPQKKIYPWRILVENSSPCKN